ncbi:MAG: hypothetical protein EXQ52_03400 [Bryobacterales bacterium]|nr:hypothetical protein [Bryobacterales bacterium]
MRQCIGKMTGMSRAPVTRLIQVYAKGEEVKVQPHQRHQFPGRYRREDIELLAAVDEAHETLSGPPTQELP